MFCEVIYNTNNYVAILFDIALDFLQYNIIVPIGTKYKTNYITYGTAYIIQFIT